MILLEVLLVLLHDPAGREIWVNPNTVVALKSKVTGEHLQKDAKCLINLEDGKFVAVAEDCEAVRRKLGEQK